MECMNCKGSGCMNCMGYCKICTPTPWGDVIVCRECRARLVRAVLILQSSHWYPKAIPLIRRDGRMSTYLFMNKYNPHKILAEALRDRLHYGQAYVLRK